MAYSSGDLRREIHNIVAAHLAAGHTVRWAWLITDVLKNHPLPVIPDLDFNRLCRQLAIGDAVRDVLRTLKLNAEDPSHVSSTGMLPLPGYNHLQQGYPFERDGELVIVPIDKLTKTERRSRAAQYRAMAAGCIEHADELDRYEPSGAAA